MSARITGGVRKSVQALKYAADLSVWDAAGLEGLCN